MFGRFSRKAKAAIALGSVLGVTGYLGATGNEWFYKKIVMKCVQRVDAETAHVMAVKCAALGLVPKARERPEDKEILETKLLKMTFPNPIGLAAGFDKHAECFDGMLKTGFGFVEIGSVTPKPQDGNAKPRVFRLLNDEAVINRYGFNSEGIDSVKKRLQKRCDVQRTGIVGVNVGKNKSTENAVEDFTQGIKELGEFADYVVVNVSSPNTPGLRKMQGKEQLKSLILEVIEARNKLENNPPIFVKIAPDLTDDDKTDISSVVMNDETRVDGLIVSNTTICRPETLQSDHKIETGGLSGKPLKELATKAVEDFYKLTEGKIPIIGVGGVSSGQDAYEKILAGASLVQLYTALAYEGPTIVSKVKRELAELLRRDGFRNVAAAVGASHLREKESKEKIE